MRNYYLLCAVAAFTLLLGGCSKEEYTTTILVKQLQTIRTNTDFTYAFSYKEDGFVDKISKIYNSYGDSSITTWQFTYDKNNQLTGFTKSFNKQQVASCAITYTDKARTAIFDQNGPVAKIAQELDANGNPITEASYYYENGAWVKEAYSTLTWADGNLVETKFDNSFVVTYQYDSRVNPLHKYFKEFISVSSLYENELGILATRNNLKQSNFTAKIFTYDNENYPTEAEVTVNSGWFQSKEKHSYQYEVKSITYKK